MGDLIRIDKILAEKDREERERLVLGIESLLERARAGELLGVCFVAIPVDRECLSVGMLKTSDCGTHELVGASAMMTDYLRRALCD
jgi:hypothetical protein